MTDDLKFTDEDFLNCVHSPGIATNVAKWANSILEAKLKKAQRVFGILPADKRYWIWSIFRSKDKDTHTALLVCLEKIKK